MAVRQDKVQIRVEFITDESKALAKTITETARFTQEMKAAQKEVKNLEKELADLQKAGKDTTDVENRLIEANRRVSDSFREATAAGRSLAGLDLSRVANVQLSSRAKQIKEQLNIIADTTSDTYRRLESELQAINTQLAVTNQRTRGVAAAMDEGRKNSSAFFTGLTTFVAMATVAFTGLQRLASALFKPSQLASEMEQAMIAFETMLGSARQAKKLVNEVIKLAATTPFEQAELIDYTKRLAAMGIETQKLVPTMKSLGDIAAGVGKEKLPQIVLAFGQVATKTKLAGGELKQFTEAGVPLIAALATQLGKGEKEIIKLTEAGKIGFKDVEKAIENLTTGTGKFAGLMAKQAQTTDGLLSTLKDNVNLALAAFGDGFNVALKDILKSATALTNGLDRQTMREFGLAVGNALKFLIEFGPTLLRIVAVYGIYRVATALVTAETGLATVAQVAFRVANIAGAGVMALLSGNLTRAAAAMRLFTTATAVNPLGLVVAGISAAIIAMQLYAAKLNELTASQKALIDVRESATESAAEEVKRSNELFAVLKDETVSRETRHEAFLRLQELYPSVLKDYKTEELLLANLETAHLRVNQAILAEAFAKAQGQKINQITNDVIDLEIKKAEAEAIARQKNAQFATENNRPKGLRIQNDGYENTGLVNASRELMIASDAVKLLQGQITEKMGSVKAITDATNESFVVMAQSLGSTTLAFNRFDAEISVLEKRLKTNPADQLSKDRLEAVKRAKEAEAKEIVRGEQRKKVTPDAPDKDAESAAKKAAKSELDALRAATQERINEATVRNLKLGKLEKDFEVELLQIKEAGLQGSKELGIKGELEFLETRKKIFVGEYEKTEAELLKTQRTIREKQNAEALSDLHEAAEKRQTALELELAKGEITEGAYKIRSLEIKRGEHAEKLGLLKAQGKETTEEYAKTLLEQSRTERQLATATLDNTLDTLKNAAAKKMDALEVEYQSGKISEAVYQQEKLQIIIEGLDAQLAALETGGNKESDLYRQLTLQKIKAQHDALERQIAVELAGIQGMSDAEKEGLTKRLEDGRINRNRYDLLMLEDKEAVLRRELAVLKAHGDATKAQQEKVEAEITAVKKAEAEKQRAIETENQEYKAKILNASAGLFKDILQFEIDALGKSAEEKKKNAEKIKRLQKAQIIISSIAEIADIWKSYASLPVLGQILAGIQTAVVVARTVSGINQIDSQTFARGGFTGPGMSYTDATGERPAGIVHANEYVIPRRMVQNAQLAPIIQQLEYMRLRGFAEGGFVNTTPTVSFSAAPLAVNAPMANGMLVEIKGLREDVAGWHTRLKAVFVRNEYENLVKQDAADLAAAAL